MALTQAQAQALLPMVEQGDTKSIGKYLRAIAEGHLTALGGVNATVAEINNVADVSGRVQEMTVSGAVAPGIMAIELNHATVVVAATIADLKNHQGLLIVKNRSATGTAAHTVTVTTGTWNGTNKVLTLDLLNEAIAFWIDSAGNGTILENVGTVVING